MTKTKKLLLTLLVLSAMVVVAVFVFQKQVATRLMQQMAHKNVGRNIIPTLPDGLHLTPAMSARASRVSRCRCRKRLSGRAPKTGS